MHPDLAAILDETRAQIARGDTPNASELEARIRSFRQPHAAEALEQLQRLLALDRARRSLQSAAPPPRPAPQPARRATYRAKPAIAANMAVKASAGDGAVVLEWPAAPGVASWEVRVSERPDARSNYVELELVELAAPRLDLELGERPRRVQILGRNARGRLVQRAVVSGLTAENWDTRWLQRASAS